MTHNILISLVAIIVLGIGAQWIAWRIHLPSILLLLIFGFIAGPAMGLIDPDALFGDLLLPIVSMSVAVILFEGGLNLRIAELSEVGGVVRNLVSVGVLVTWLIGTGAAHIILGFDWPIAALLGAIMVVTGPTVIEPLLRHVRLIGRVGSVLRWESILIDPIGAMLAVLVFEAILAGGFQEARALVVTGLFKTILIGSLSGILSAGVLIVLMQQYLIPDFLQNPVTLMVVVSAFTASNMFQTESGLFAVTVMGIALANQKTVSVKHIIEFKENLRVLLISSLFILLAARLQVSTLAHIGVSTFAFLGVLFLVARPLSVILSTLGSTLSLRERLLLSWVAPRGIVAAAVSSIFALRLTEMGHPQAESIVSLTFVVIIVTVAVYGLTLSPVARWLKVAQPNPQGTLIVGAHSWARAIASALQEEGFQVLLVDTNWRNISTARMAGIPTYHGNILSEYILREIKLDEIGRLLAMTSNDEVNSLAALRFIEIFGRNEVYQLPLEGDRNAGKNEVSQHLHGRFLFNPEITYSSLSTRFIIGTTIKKTNLTDKFDFNAFQKQYDETPIPLFLINEEGDLKVFATDNPPTMQAGQTLISLIKPVKES